MCTMSFDAQGDTIGQRLGGESSMEYDLDGGRTTVRADMPGSYSVDRVVDSWQRAIEFRAGEVRIVDTRAVDAGVSAIW